MSSLLLRADVLFNGANLLRSPRVLIADDVITAVSTHEDPPYEHETTVINLPGITLLPGLIDSHVHATLPGGMVPPTEPDQLVEVATGNLRLAAQAGITYVRDCGSPGDTLLRLRDDAPEELARCLVAGPALTLPGGHAHTLGREVAGVKALRAVVDDLADAKVDFIKVIGCGGGTPGTDPLSSSYTANELRAVIDTARSRGLPVTVHALNADTIQLGLDAGVQNFEHGWLYQDAHPLPSGAVLERLAESGAVICPTIWAVAHRIPLLRRQLDESPSDSLARAELDAVQRLTELVLRSVSDCHAAGIRVIAGTDAGWRGVAFGELVDELLLLQQCGLSPIDAIASATQTPADALGLGNRAGRIAPGWTADLIAVSGDPSIDLGALRQIEMTILRGQPLDQPRGQEGRQPWIQTP